MDSDPGDPYRLHTPEKVARSRALNAGLPEPDIAYKGDHAVQIALGSLHSDSGVIDNRLAATAFHRNAKDTALDREAVAVGLWTRYHRFDERPGRPRKPAVLAITLVAMRIPLGKDAYWPTLMYSDQGWLPPARARALHHAGAIGKKGHHLREDYGALTTCGLMWIGRWLHSATGFRSSSSLRSGRGSGPGCATTGSGTALFPGRV
ncbi:MULTISPECIES: RNaseH domain-containing protein [unclassified Streptomyces]|uniref:RNaseH domain-containing protein n=1 Tax=unclassified Streptomyces TaxID=2593676 RepID=UPI000823E5DC|nr:MULTISPECIES: RNaseH domain-containing protein [unclassified Streptomyces]SCK63161.1 hypothetical protein YW7DRAFT_07015 [Streptomyces sp. AmelKG-E11A]